MSYAMSMEATRWDVWLHTFSNQAGYEQLSGSRLVAIVTDDGMGAFTVDCMDCGKPIGDPKAGPDHGYGHPAKVYKSRGGARSAFMRHYAKKHAA